MSNNTFVTFDFFYEIDVIHGIIIYGVHELFLKCKISLLNNTKNKNKQTSKRKTLKVCLFDGV
jgi:hypothetical protein